MIKTLKLFISIIIVFFIASNAFALPFRIVPNGTLPTLIMPSTTFPVTASYTITNISNFNPPYNLVKWLPPNVTVNPVGTTCTPTSRFQLAPGQSCILNLTISGGINRNDPNPQQHLMICMSDKVSCAGPTPQNSLNITPIYSWINSLTSKGYTAIRGSVFLMVNSECPQFVSVFNSCFGQNPASPYVVPQPPVGNAYVDPYYATAFTEVGPNGVPVNIFYRLTQNEAMVTIVSYPPLAAYFGYQSYLFTSQTSNYLGITPPRSRTISPDPNRYDIFGSIGNDVNNVIVQNQYGSAPWNGTVIIYITTANQALANAIISEAIDKNINANSIFVEPVGPNVRIGNGAKADDMLTLMRFAVPKSSAEATTWNNAVKSNVLVFKVTNANVNVSTYGANQYTAHTVNNVELSLSTALQQLAELLQTYLTSAQGGIIDIKPLTATTVDNAQGIPTSGLVGAFCILFGTNCEGDNQDTSTYANLLLARLGVLETAFIAGVNHNVLNNNRYTSVDIYNAANSSGVASSSQTNPPAVGFNSGNLTGSAQAVLSALGIAIPPGDTALIANISRLYVTFIARDCTNSTISAAQQYCIAFTTAQIPLGDPVSVTERSYIVPGTTTGGNMNFMLYPLVVAARTDFPLA